MSSVEESSLAMNAQFVKALSIDSGLQEKVDTNRNLNTKEEAILARLTKEVELYKEFSPQRELLESLNL